jgi:hypothetical protein
MAAQDETRSYQELELWLKLLQYQAPQMQGRRWLLKSVHHFIGRNLATLMKTFPEAAIIMTHRRMEQVIPSLCSVQSMHLRQSGSRSFDQRDMGRRLIEQYQPALADVMALRTQTPAGKFIDVQYRDLLADPIGQFRAIMEGIGLGATPEDLHEVSTWMARNGRETHPPHSYAPEDFGVTAAELRSEFASYHDAFAVK